jgi:hypothetical protein
MPEPEVRNRNGALIAILIVAGLVVIAVGAYWLVRQLYIDTHCAEVLGTLVCR